jgi:hypothetical protein
VVAEQLLSGTDGVPVFEEMAERRGTSSVLGAPQAFVGLERHGAGRIVPCREQAQETRPIQTFPPPVEPGE